MLLLDEPFSALDVDTRRSLRQTMLELKNELDIPIVHVTHDLEEAAMLGDTVIAVNAGIPDEQWLGRNMPAPRRHAAAPVARSAACGASLRTAPVSL
jgi:molybdate transport system ATP-binding protein